MKTIKECKDEFVAGSRKSLGQSETILIACLLTVGFKLIFEILIDIRDKIK